MNEGSMLATLIGGLRNRGLSLAVAESLTGGALSAAIVSVSGASDVYKGGVTTYSAESKVSVLGVSSQLIDSGGTVQAEVALQMALGVQELFGADVAMSTTGVAGPGPAEGHPAGTVHICLAGPGVAKKQELHLKGSRQQIRELTVEASLQLLGDFLGGGLS